MANNNNHRLRTVYGFHTVKALLQNKNAVVNKICLLANRQDKRIQEMLNLAKTRNAPCELVTRSILDQLTNYSAKHQGFVALCSDVAIPTHITQHPKHIKTVGTIETTTKNSEENLHDLVLQVASQAFLLILDGVQDPHNLGACLRTANAAGVHAVIAPRDNAVGLTSTARKVACGAAEITPFFQVTNLARVLHFLREQNIWIYGLAPEAEKSIFEVALKPPLALVMGAEEKGLRRLTREQCDVLINIPMRGAVESLNVSVATGICLFEVVRSFIQRLL